MKSFHNHIISLQGKGQQILHFNDWRRFYFGFDKLFNLMEKSGDYGFDGVAFHFFVERMILNFEQIDIIAVQWTFEMFQNVMIKRLFGFVNYEKENKGDNFEDAILLLLKIKNLDSFMKRYKFLYPEISFCLGFLEAEESAFGLFGLD